MVEIAQSGSSNFVKYKIPTFKFDSSSQVYLHAKVRICFVSKMEEIGKTCQNICANSRKRRENSRNFLALFILIKSNKIEFLL